MFIRNALRFNIYASATIDGVTYPHFEDASIRERLGITEIPDPTPPADYSDETYYRTEQDESPYVIYTRKSQEQLDQLHNAKIKMQIAALEATQSRSIREATLTGDKTRLQALDDEIAALRGQLK